MPHAYTSLTIGSRTDCRGIAMEQGIFIKLPRYPNRDSLLRNFGRFQ
jgi:hypothetical protein